MFPEKETLLTLHVDTLFWRKKKSVLSFRRSLQNDEEGPYHNLTLTVKLLQQMGLTV